jgi:hypothetical protein
VLLRNLKKFSGGFLFEEVVDDLNRIDPPAPHQIDDAVLVVFRRRYTDQADLSLTLQFAENFERSRVFVPCPGPCVELEQVDTLGAQFLQALLQILAEIGFRVALLRLAVWRWRPRSRNGRSLRGDKNTILIATVAQNLGDGAFAAPIAITGGGIDQRDTEIESPVEGFDGVILRLLAPAAADGPATKANFRDFFPRFSERTLFHGRRLVGTTQPGFNPQMRQREVSSTGETRLVSLSKVIGGT